MIYTPQKCHALYLKGTFFLTAIARYDRIKLGLCLKIYTPK